MKDVMLREFKMSDWEDAWEIWEKELKDSNDNSWDKKNVESFINRNPGLSSVAIVDGKLAGTVMCGYDGRRGYIYHLAVSNTKKRNGIGTALMGVAISKLKEAGAGKVHLMILAENECAKIFYDKLGFKRRNDITLMSSNNNI
jgi:ribosomal protein S18 acetylase RimI-like enzyme